VKQLVIFPRRVGLFSLFLQVLGHVHACRATGTVPIVYFNSTSLYWSDAGLHGARNVWEYYFEPVSDRAVTDAVDADLARLEHCTIWEFTHREVDGYTPPPADPAVIGSIPVRAGTLVSNVFPARVIDWVWEMARARRLALHRELLTSIRLRPAVAGKLEAFVEREMAGRHVLGVHIRGVERARQQMYLAPGGTVSLEHYQREIDAYLARHPASFVFCATDTQWVLDALTERHGSRLLSYPATRLSAAEEPVGLHHLPAARHDKGLLGEEVLIECYALARCDFLLHGASGVSLAATLINPGLGHLDVYVKYGYRFPRLRYAVRRSRVTNVLRRLRRGR